MKMRMEVEGLDSLTLALKNIRGEATSSARKQMHLAADRVVALAKDMAPEGPPDELGGTLRDSIHKEVARHGSTRRLLLAVVAGGVSPQGVNIDQYASIIHENYESLLSDPVTIERRDRKQRRTGQIVGSKFLDRALAPEEKGLEKHIIDAFLLIKGIT